MLISPGVCLVFLIEGLKTSQPRKPVHAPTVSRHNGGSRVCPGHLFHRHRCACRPLASSRADFSRRQPLPPCSRKIPILCCQSGLWPPFLPWHGPLMPDVTHYVQPGCLKARRPHYPDPRYRHRCPHAQSHHRRERISLSAPGRRCLPYACPVVLRLVPLGTAIWRRCRRKWPHGLGNTCYPSRVLVQRQLGQGLGIS